MTYFIKYFSIIIFIISFSYTQNECFEFEREECETLSLCIWTDEGCTILNDEDWGDDHDWDEEDWEDECRLLETEEDCVESGCMWDAEEGCYKGDEEEWEDEEEWGDDHDWDDEDLGLSLPKSEIVISEKDQKLPKLKNIDSEFLHN